ncbi:hypothetical protein SUGI_0707570 [Cryptomeria japonica]|nr:hypothetical protein SUGI_0707570 [Cryptomeria japonica]
MHVENMYARKVQRMEKLFQRSKGKDGKWRIVVGHAMPRAIWLDNISKSQLIQWPAVSELESLHANKIYKENIILKSGSAIEIGGVKATQVDVEVSFNLPSLTDLEKMDANLDAEQLCSKDGAASKSMVGPFGLLVLAEQTAIFFRVSLHQNKKKILICSDKSR